LLCNSFSQSLLSLLFQSDSVVYAMCSDTPTGHTANDGAAAVSLQKFRALRQETVDELNALADDFEKGNRRGQKGKIVGATVGIAGAATALTCGILSGGTAVAVPAVVAAKVLIGAKVATGSGSATACGFSIGAHGKNRRRRRAAEACLQNERYEMEHLRRELDAIMGEPHFMSSEHRDRIGKLSMRMRSTNKR